MSIEKKNVRDDDEMKSSRNNKRKKEKKVVGTRASRVKLKRKEVEGNKWIHISIVR